MHFINLLADLSKLGRIHVFTDTTSTKPDSLVPDPPTEMDSHLQLGFFVTRKTQTLVHPSDKLAKRFFVNSPRFTQVQVYLITQFIRITKLIASFRQQVGQQLLALHLEFGQPHTDVEQVIVIKLGKLLFQFTDLGSFHDVSTKREFDGKTRIRFTGQQISVSA